MSEDRKTDRVAILADHYHRSADSTSRRWQERNRQFLLLIGALGLAVLLTANANDTDSLLIGLLAKFTGVGETEVAKLRESFPELPEAPTPREVFVKLRELRNKW